MCAHHHYSFSFDPSLRGQIIVWHICREEIQMHACVRGCVHVCVLFEAACKEWEIRGRGEKKVGWCKGGGESNGGMMRGGAGQETGVIASRFPPPPPARYNRYIQISLGIIIWNPPSQCQILILNSLTAVFIISPSPVPLSSLVFIFIFLSLYHTLSSNSHLCSHAHMQMHILLPPLQRPIPSPNWVLEDLSKPRGRKSTFLPHQLAKPNVEKVRLKALLLLMLTAIGKAPFA